MQQRFLEPAVKAVLQRIEMVSLPVMLARECCFRARTGGLREFGRWTNQSVIFIRSSNFRPRRLFFVLGELIDGGTLTEKLSTRPTTLLGEYVRNAL
jgi:hypothetical protein